MTARPGLFIANGSAGVSAPQDTRLALAGLLAGEPGVVAGTGGAVTGSSSGPNMQYIVPASVFATVRGVLATDGSYLWANDGNITVNTATPAPGSGSRYDLIWARALNANDGFGDANSTPVLGFTVGTASGSPVKPYASVPAGAYVLAESLVGTSIANASLATITQVSTSVVAAGGVLPCASSATYPAAPYEGQHVDDAALNALLRYDGAAWRTVVRDRTTYSPTWACVGSAPVLGNGTLTGWYQVVGRQCQVSIELIFGTTTTGGTQGWSFTLPITAVAGPSGILSGEAFTSNTFAWVAYGRIASGASTVLPFAATNNTSGSTSQVQNANAGAGVGTGVPAVAGAFSFANGSRLSLFGSYWIA